jgi:hypothetical protein
MTKRRTEKEDLIILRRKIERRIWLKWWRRSRCRIIGVKVVREARESGCEIFELCLKLLLPVCQLLELI